MSSAAMRNSLTWAASHGGSESNVCIRLTTFFAILVTYVGGVRPPLRDSCRSRARPGAFSLRLSRCAFLDHRCQHAANQGLEVRLLRRFVSQCRDNRLQRGTLAAE